MIQFRLLRKVHTYRTEACGFKVEIYLKVWDAENDCYMYCGRKSNPSNTLVGRFTAREDFFHDSIRNGSYIPSGFRREPTATGETA